MYTLVLLRHGQSVHNLEGKFSGWSDVSLTEQGRDEAIQAGKILKERNYTFDEAHTNLLTRAIVTTWLALEQMNLVWIPIFKHWRLNERCYGALQTFTHAELEQKVGKEQVFLWRRGFDNQPPLLDESDPRFPNKDPRYQNIPNELIPRGESLKQTLDRVMPYWTEVLVPAIKSDRRLLISASHNSLRAIIKHLENIDDETIPTVVMPTGKPYVYTLDENLNIVEKTIL